MQNPAPPDRGPRMDLLPRGPAVQLDVDKGLKKFKPGDIVYFKRIKETSKTHGRYQEFKNGHGFGILLGAVPQGAEDPPLQYLMHLMGGQGWVSFDDVAALLGKEQMDLLLERFTKKYYGDVPPAQSTPKENQGVPHGNS